MAHFAKIGQDNIVEEVIVVSNDVVDNLPFPESEPLGQEYCNNLLGGFWLQTSYNDNFRAVYAGIGYVYDSILDVFIPSYNPPVDPPLSGTTGYVGS
jgi:hypothetical protein